MAKVNIEALSSESLADETDKAERLGHARHGTLADYVKENERRGQEEGIKLPGSELLVDSLLRDQEEPVGVASLSLNILFYFFI